MMDIFKDYREFPLFFYFLYYTDFLTNESKHVEWFESKNAPISLIYNQYQLFCYQNGRRRVSKTVECNFIF